MSKASWDDSARCKTCHTSLSFIYDRQKSTGRAWTNCHTCRERQTRRKRMLGPPSHRTALPRIYYPPPGLFTPLPADKYPSAAPWKTNEVGKRPHTPDAADQRLKISKVARYRTPTVVPDQVTKPNVNANLETECSVCSDTFPNDQLPRLEQCTHDPKVCQGCFGTWLTTQVNTAKFDQITCPSEKCNTLISNSDMQRLASPGTFAK
jgi:hypothetical protein